MNIKKNSVKIFSYRILCGFLLGVSVIAPGVSGSVMAVIMGIYGDLIGIVSAPFNNFKRNIVYLIPLGIGGLLSAALLIRVLRDMFDAYPIPSFLLFMGLIAGSLPAVFREAMEGGFKPRYALSAAAAFTAAVIIGLLAEYERAPAAAGAVWYFGLCGLIAGMASMVPGMSISMILMLLGVYKPMLEATSRLDILTMAPVAVCFAAGMFLFSRVTKFMLDRNKSLVYFTVCGFMCGSLVGIFPGIPSSVAQGVAGAVAAAAGIAISTLFRKLSEKIKA